MTITPERLENMAISLPYLENSQVVVVKLIPASRRWLTWPGKTRPAGWLQRHDALDAAVEFKESLAEVVPLMKMSRRCWI